MYQKLLLFILLIVELTKITFCRLKFLLFLSWCGAKLFKALQTVCLCFKLGSLYFIKTTISFSLLKKVENSIHKSHFLVENIKITAILLNSLISSKAVENSPQFWTFIKVSYTVRNTTFLNTAPLSLKQFLQGFYLFTYVPLRNKFFRIFLESLLSLYLGSYVSYVPMHLTCLSGLVP